MINWTIEVDDAIQTIPIGEILANKIDTLTYEGVILATKAIERLYNIRDKTDRVAIFEKLVEISKIMQENTSRTKTRQKRLNI